MSGQREISVGFLSIIPFMGNVSNQDGKGTCTNVPHSHHAPRHDEGVQIAEPGLGAHGLGPGQQQHLMQVPQRLKQVGEKRRTEEWYLKVKIPP